MTTILCCLISVLLFFNGVCPIPEWVYLRMDVNRSCWFWRCRSHSFRNIRWKPITWKNPLCVRILNMGSLGSPILTDRNHVIGLEGRFSFFILKLNITVIRNKKQVNKCIVFYLDDPQCSSFYPPSLQVPLSSIKFWWRVLHQGQPRRRWCGAHLIKCVFVSFFSCF